MGYNATYVATDTSAVIVDLIVGIGGALFSFISLIALVILFRWFKTGKLKVV